MGKVKGSKLSVVKASPYPKKKEERSEDIPADVVINDDSPPPELARSYSVAEAKNIIGLAIKPIDVRVMETEIVGDDLIANRWTEKAMRQMLANMTMTKEEKKIAKDNRPPRNPKEEFEAAKYHWDGKDWFPANALKKAMVSSGYALGIARSIIQRSVFVLGATRRDYVEIKAGRVVMREDAVQVRDKMGKKSADLRYRPEYQNWSAKLRIKYRADMISDAQVLALLADAGFSNGIGEWRTEKGGQAGSFEVKAIAEKGKRNVA